MIRSAFPIAMLAATVVATPSSAGEIHCRAQPAAAISQTRLILGGLVWTCGAAGCVTGKSNSRPLVDCQALVRRIGALRSFSVAGRDLPAPELDKCNERAR